jgi:hypothetical protein
MGALLIFDLKMLGVLPRGGIKAALRFNQIAGFGVGLNIVSGFILFSSSPERYWENPSFRLKMLLVVLALANVVWFELVERRKIVRLQDGEALHFGTKAAAALSLALWTAIIVLGRWLPVTGSG